MSDLMGRLLNTRRRASSGRPVSIILFNTTLPCLQGFPRLGCLGPGPLAFVEMHRFVGVNVRAWC